MSLFNFEFAQKYCQVGPLTEAGQGEYNSDADLEAAAEVLGSGIHVERIPLEEYSRMTIPVDEVKSVLALRSSVGSWLAERLLDVPTFVQLGTTLNLGDSVLVPFTPRASAQEPRTLPGSVVHNEIDSNQLWDDLITRLALLA
jgi:hypothetical protein